MLTPSSCLPPPDCRGGLGCACVEVVAALETIETSPLASVVPVEDVLFREGMASTWVRELGTVLEQVCATWVETSGKRCVRRRCQTAMVH